MPAQPLPILYSFRRCPYAMRARLALMASGQECELREVVLRNKPEALLHASPKGTVPVLVLPDGRVLAESLDIMLWALRRHDPHRWLAANLGHKPAPLADPRPLADPPPLAVGASAARDPETLTEFASSARSYGGDADRQIALIHETDHHFKPQLDRYKYPNRFGLDSGLPARDAGADWLLGLERRLQTNAYLFGPRPALADWAIAPFVRQYAHTDQDWFNAQTWPGLQRWLDAFLHSALFAACMEKYPAWTPDSAPVLFGPTP